MLGVSRQRVHQLATRSDFPQPVAELAQGKVWVLADIEAWISAYRAGQGRRAGARARRKVNAASLPVKRTLQHVDRFRVAVDR